MFFGIYDNYVMLLTHYDLTYFCQNADFRLFSLEYRLFS